MSTSLTYDFEPSLGEMVLYSYNLIGIRSTSIVMEHMTSARMAANLLQANWSNRGVNLWAVDLQSVPLVKGQATYCVPDNTVVILDAYMGAPNSPCSCLCETDRIILPVSRTEYASYPNKCQQGFTTVFWFDRLICPQITLWPVPDGSSAQYLKYYRVRQIQDANLANTPTTGNNMEIPYRFLEAYADGLALRLARIWAPARVAEMKGFADESYMIAALQDIETANQYITPMLSQYYRP